jgi:hypothetical protein
MFSTNGAPILHRHLHSLKMDQNKIPHDPRHIGVASGASKTISKPMVISAQTVHLSCVKISTIPKQTKMSFHLSLKPRSVIRFVQNDFCAYGTIGANGAPILHWNEIPHDPRNLGVPSGASKIIYEPVVLSTQTVHLSYIKISKLCTYLLSTLTLSWNGAKELHLVRLKWFSRPWYVWPEPCIDLASRLALSLNGLKWAFTWASQPRIAIGCV